MFLAVDIIMAVPLVNQVAMQTKCRILGMLISERDPKSWRNHNYMLTLPCSITATPLSSMDLATVARISSTLVFQLHLLFFFSELIFTFD